MRNREMIEMVKDFESVADKHVFSRNSGVLWKMNEYLENSKKIIEIIKNQGSREQIEGLLLLLENGKKIPWFLAISKSLDLINTREALIGDEFTPLRNVFDSISHGCMAICKLATKASEFAESYTGPNGNIIPNGKIKNWENEYKKLKWDASNIEEKYEVACKMLKKFD